MNKTCIIYGSSTGTCEDLASRIANKLGVDAADVLGAADITSDQLANYQNLILGTSTWGAGELQDDWYDGVGVIKNTDLTGKVVAIFGCGDSESYSDTFCGGMAELYNAAKESGAKVVGEVSTEGYTYDDSEAVVDGKFMGLALDEVNEDDKSNDRIAAWIEQIKPEL
ncbi:flavodoxin FldA [Prevotella sp.]|uniref:flavodoxin FldA n=1 Tax=Prevotella sp. TaxID=59823 RepID=UPI002F923AFD